MKKLLFIPISICCALTVFSQSFVSPIGYADSEEARQRVIAYIQKEVKATYSAIGMGDESTLRMMEKENLNAFKELITITNTTLLSQVIKKYCDIGMCNYSTILMMYKEENKASKETLKW